jgi:GAF domain-containing protein
VNPARDERLVQALLVLAAPTPDVDEAGYLRTLADECVAVCPVQAAAVLLPGLDGRLYPAAATDAAAREAVLMELASTDGPSMACFTRGEPVSVEDLAAPDARWPRLAGSTAGTGYRARHLLPLRSGDKVVGVLELLRTAPGPVLPRDADPARELADVAAVVLLRQRAMRDRRDTARRLQAALDSRVVIEQAKGMLAERLDAGVSAAADHLVRYAQRRSITLTEAAREVVGGTDLSDGRRGQAGPR